MNRKLQVLMFLLLGMASLPAFADFPSRIEAEYDVNGFGMTLANVSETFVRNGDTYRIESVTRAVGLLARFKPETVRIISEGKITAQGLQPQNFSMTRELDTGKNTKVRFDWDKSIVTHTDYKGVNNYPLHKDTQDRLSILYQLPQLLAGNLVQTTMDLTDGNNIEAYTFRFSTETARVRVPFGAFNTHFITNIPKGDEVKYEIWLMVEHDNYPCKIIVTDSGGGKLTQELTSFNITP